MHKDAWDKIWGHYIGALGLPTDETRRKQGNSWYLEFARALPEETVKRTMRRIMEDVAPGCDFPDFGTARSHFDTAATAEALLMRTVVAPCAECNNTGLVQWCAYRSGEETRWMDFENYVLAVGTCRLATATQMCRCTECARGNVYTNFPSSPMGDAGRALDRRDRLYGSRA